MMVLEQSGYIYAEGNAACDLVLFHLRITKDADLAFLREPYNIPQIPLVPFGPVVPLVPCCM